MAKENTSYDKSHVFYINFSHLRLRIGPRLNFRQPDVCCEFINFILKTELTHKTVTLGRQRQLRNAYKCN